MQRFMDIARACRPQFFGRRRASRLAHEAILRAKARAASAHKTNANAKNN
jgi:hypothetical protein